MRVCLCSLSSVTMSCCLVRYSALILLGDILSAVRILGMVMVRVWY